MFGDNVRLQAEEIIIGKNSYIGHNNYLFSKVKIGDYFMSGPNVGFMGGNNGCTDVIEPMIFQKCTSIGIEIGNDVWIGTGTVILDGVKIASHSIIGAGSIVTKSLLEEWGIYVGNPAKIIGKRKNANI